MSVFVILATIALLLKVSVWIMARRIEGESRIFLNLILIFAAHNSSELLVYFNLLEAAHFTSAMKVYYCATLVCLAFICHYANFVTGRPSQMLNYFLIATCVLTSTLILSSDLVIAGATPIGDLVTAVRGEFYFVFQLIMLSGFVYVSGILLGGAITSKDKLISNRCWIVMLALAPLIVLGVFVVIAMAFESHITAAGIVPFGTSIFLLILLKMEASHRLTDVRVVLPFSLENDALLDLKSHFSKYALGTLTHKEAIEGMERIMLLYKHTRMKDANMTERAESLGIKRPTLYDSYKRLGISPSQK